MDRGRHPWIAGNLTIRREALAELEAEARSAYARGEEACGYLTGPATEPLLVDQAVAMPNLANKYHAVDPEGYPRTGREYFLMDSRKFEKAVEEGERGGRPVKILWHSHLDVGAYFSATDAAAANMGGDSPANAVAYVVTSVRQGVVDDHKLFVWDGERRAFVEAAMTVEGAG